MLYIRLVYLFFSFSSSNNSYQYDWKLEEARKNILRTHTTAVSTKMLYQLGQQVSVVHSHE